MAPPFTRLKVDRARAAVDHLAEGAPPPRKAVDIGQRHAVQIEDSRTRAAEHYVARRGAVGQGVGVARFERAAVDERPAGITVGIGDRQRAWAVHRQADGAGDRSRCR